MGGVYSRGPNGGKIPVRDSKGNPVKSGVPDSGTSAVPSYDSFADFQKANPQIAGLAKSIIDKTGLGGFLGGDPSASRLMSAGITKGANPMAMAQSMAASNPAVGVSKTDHRVRLSLPPKSKILYNSAMTPALIAPLQNTNGIIFPYTPQVIFQHTAEYSKTSPTHTNYPYNFYNSSAVQDITVFGNFTATSGPEAEYVIAVITFLRAVTKMFGNADGALAGNPPPILRLSGHGTHLLPHLPVIVNTVSVTLPSDIDYFTIPSPMGGTTRVPRSTEVSIGLTPIYSRAQIKQLGIEALASGSLINPETGGFI